MITLRKATMADAPRLYLWRNHYTTRSMMRSTEEILWEDHLPWLRNVIEDTDRVLHIAELDGLPVGSVRFDVDHDEAEISVMVAPECRGVGIGSEVILAATRRVLDNRMVQKVIARVKPTNNASQKAFARAGYLVWSHNETEVIMICQSHAAS